MSETKAKINVTQKKVSKKPIERIMNVGVISLGCDKNRVDSEIMLTYLSGAGYKFTADAANADILIVNTCGFIETARSESMDAIAEMVEYRKNPKYRCKRLIVTGCLPQRWSANILNEFPEIDIILGIDIDNALKSKSESVLDYYQARLEALKISNASEIDTYRPINPELMFFTEKDFNNIINNKSYVRLSNLSIPTSDSVLSYNAIPQQNYSSLKNINNLTVYENLKQELSVHSNKKRIICYTIERKVLYLY